LSLSVFVAFILHTARFCTLPVRAFISIEQKVNKPALLPVRAFISYLFIPCGEEETGGVRFSMDMISLTGNAHNRAACSIPS
jgi:hypothetical protein